MNINDMFALANPCNVALHPKRETLVLEWYNITSSTIRALSTELGHDQSQIGSHQYGHYNKVCVIISAPLWWMEMEDSIVHIIWWSNLEIACWKP